MGRHIRRGPAITLAYLMGSHVSSDCCLGSLIKKPSGHRKTVAGHLWQPHSSHGPGQPLCPRCGPPPYVRESINEIGACKNCEMALELEMAVEMEVRVEGAVEGVGAVEMEMVMRLCFMQIQLFPVALQMHFAPG